MKDICTFIWVFSAIHFWQCFGWVTEHNSTVLNMTDWWVWKSDVRMDTDLPWLIDFPNACSSLSWPGQSQQCHPGLAWSGQEPKHPEHFLLLPRMWISKKLDRSRGKTEPQALWWGTERPRRWCNWLHHSTRLTSWLKQGNITLCYSFSLHSFYWHGMQFICY